MFYLGTMANGQHACVLNDTTVTQFHDTRLNIMFNDDGLMECNIRVNWEDFTVFSNVKYFIFQSKRIINLITWQGSLDTLYTIARSLSCSHFVYF